MPEFEVDVTMTVRLRISDAVLALSQDPDWVRDFYGLDTPEKIAEHLAWNLGVRDRDLDDLDGFADQPRSAAHAEVIDTEYGVRRVS